MKNTWIRSPLFDLCWILAPGLLPVLIVVVFRDAFKAQTVNLSTASWVVLILLVDVAHVYSTVYRTYFDPQARQKHGTLFKTVPFICWIVGVLLYSLDALLFWRCLAYLAVFHFVRQQYGFLRIYSRHDELPRWIANIHTLTIYAVTILPVLIWHTQGPKNFNWFIENDFLYFRSPVLASVFQILFYGVVVLYLLVELLSFRRQRSFNLPRILLVGGTALSWYIGIVVYDGDLSFTFLNVLAHGIPYMALVWAMGSKQTKTDRTGILRYFFRSWGIVLFLLLLFAFSFVEEGLWDSLVWREHSSLFSFFWSFGPVQHQKILCFLIPLLALPQAVHYVLDGFIWRLRKNESNTAPELSDL